MRTKLNILLIEDSENDAILIMRELGKIDTNAVFERVDNAIALNKALEKEWDIIISDYSMPGFGGTEALKMVRKRNEDIPFIIVSGTIGEDVAVETMRNGANDYLMKNNLKRLNAAVLRELKDYEIKKERILIKEQLREKEDLYKTLVETSPDSIVLIDVTGKVIIANNKAAIIAGIDDVNEVIGKSIFDFMVPEELERVKKDLNDSILNKKNKNIEQRLLRKDGSIIYVEANVGQIFDESGTLKLLTLITRDITERMEDEQKIKRLNRVYAYISGINKLIVRTKNIKELFNEACRIGTEVGKYDMVWVGMVDNVERKVKPVAWSGAPGEYFENLVVSIDPVPEGRGPTGTAVREGKYVINNDIMHDEKMAPWSNRINKFNYHSSSSFPLKNNNDVIGAISFYSKKKSFFDEAEINLLSELSLDLSYAVASINQEQLRIKAEEELKKSEEKYHQFFNDDLTGDYITTLEGQIIMCNPTFVKIFAAESIDDVVKKNVNDLYPDPETRIEFLTRLKKHKKLESLEVKLRRFDGKIIDVMENLVGVFDKKGELVQIKGYLYDETEKKKTEEAVKESEKRYRNLFENAAIAIWEEDLSDVKKYLDDLKENGVSDFSSYFAKHMDEVVKCASMAKLLDINKEVLNIVKGSTKEEVLQSLPNFFVEESMEAAKEELIGLSEGKSRIDGEMPIKILNGKIIQILFQLTIVPGYEDTWSKVLFSFVDITERKEIEKSLRLFRLLMDKSKDAIEVIDMETGEFTDVNEKACIELGYKRSELLRMNIFDIDPNQNIQSFKLLIPKLQASNSMMLESLHRRKDGTTFPVELNIAVVKLEKLFTVVMVRDITERKIAEKELAASEERYRQLFQSAAEGIVVVDVESKEYKYVNNAACKMFGYSEQEMIGMNVADLHPPENLSSVISEFESKGSEKINMSIDIPCLRKDGTIFYATFNKAVADIDGRQHNIGFITDTTAQKESVEKIKFLAHALESINECISITDLNDNLTFVNSAFCKKYGYENNELLGKNYKIVRSENNSEELTSEIQIDTLDGGWAGELLNKRKNGEEFPVYLYTSKINNDNGDPIGLLGISTDITERKRNEEQILTSQQQFRSVWENSADAMRLTKEDGTIVLVNKAFCNLVDLEKSVLEDNTFDIIYKPEKRVHIINKHKNNFISRSVKTHDERKITLWNDRELWVEITNSFLEFEKQPAMLLGIFRDITDRKKTEELIITSEQQFRSVWENSFDSMRLCDSNGIIVSVNPAFCRLVGKSVNELEGLPFISAYDPAESNDLHSFKNNLKNNSIKQKMESKIILWNKKEIWVELSNSMVLLEGKPKMVLSIIRDITERKHAEEEIRKLYRGVQQSPATVVITDKSGKIEYVNNKFYETTGYSNSEVIGQNPRMLKSGEKTKKEYKELWDAILSGNEWHGELHNKKKNGELYWESATISPIINEKGEITHFIAIKEDITEHKMMVEELISAKEKAEEMNRLKTNFVNNMSHEMRTPLVAILGYSQFLISDIENKYQKEMLEGIENSGKRLLDTVNSILDLSRMEAKKIDFKLTEVDVIKETDGVINRMSILAWNKNLYLRLDKKSENVFSLLNVKYFVHILEKLLSNSIKYTIKGGVTIEIEKNIQDGESWSVIKVIDTGIGISKESHEIIFEEFRQASEGLNRQFEGTGLGLTLTKKYVSMMNGKITVVSKPGKGSIFTVMFKSINTAPKKNGKGEQIELEINTIHSTKKEIIKPTGKEILVVEDDNFSRDIVRLLLKDLYKIKFAENGETAIQLVENKIYDCILMDVNLGLGMSGLEATAKIKQIKGYEGIPIIAVTAYAMQGDKEKFLSSGFTQYISKPYKKETILNVLKEALNSK